MILKTKPPLNMAVRYNLLANHNLCLKQEANIQQKKKNQILTKKIYFNPTAKTKYIKRNKIRKTP